MDAGTVVAILAAAVLVFWVVGAHNRVVALRQQIVARFAPLDEQYRLRQQLLREQAERLAAGGAADAADLEAMQAALAQADAACGHAKLHPGAAGAIKSLRVAEEVLAATRARLPAATADDSLAELATRLAAGEAALGFTKRQFNDAVRAYNDAVAQFPTSIVAAVFGFRPAAPL